MRDDEGAHRSGRPGGGPGREQARRDDSPRAEGAAGGKWVVRILLAALGLAVAFGLTWYVVGSYWQPGGEAGGGGSPSRAAEPGARAGTVSAGDRELGSRRSSGPSPWLSIRAPVVTFPTLSGDTASLADHRGEAVVLNFWATWCPPCKREIPELARLQDSLRSVPATVVGVAVSSGSRDEIRSFGEEYGVNYPIWLSDPGTAATEYRAMGLPTTLLVDRRGVIRRRYLGPQTYEKLREDVRALLDTASAPPRPGSSGPDGSGGASPSG